MNKIFNKKTITIFGITVITSYFGYKYIQQYNNNKLKTELDNLEIELENLSINNNNELISENNNDSNEDIILSDNLFLEEINKNKFNIKFELITDENFKNIKTNNEYNIIYFYPKHIKKEYLDQILNNFNTIKEKISSNKINFYYEELDSLDKIKKLENQYNFKIITEDNDINVVFMKNKNLEHIFPITLNEIINNKNKFYNNFKTIIKYDNNIYNKLSKENFILLYYINKNNSEYNNNRNTFYKNTITNEIFNNDNVIPVLINDQLINNIELLEDNFYLITKNSLFNINDNNLININNNKYNIFKLSDSNIDNLYNNITNIIENNYVFNNNIFNNNDKKYRFILSYDKNMITKDYIKKFIYEFKQIYNEILLSPEHKIIKDNFNFHLTKKNFNNSEANVISFYCQDIENLNKSSYIKHQNNSITDYKDNANLKLNSNYYYSFNLNNFSKDNFINFCYDLLENKIKESERSQSNITLNKYSNKLNSKNFEKNILKDNGDNAVFYYSKNCTSCKRFLPYFEDLAFKNIKNKEKTYTNNISFNRVNNDVNNFKSSKNYFSTPILAFYKNGFKDYPLIYRNTILTKTMMDNFIKISSEYEPILNINNNIFENKLIYN